MKGKINIVDYTLNMDIEKTYMFLEFPQASHSSETF